MKKIIVLFALSASLFAEDLQKTFPSKEIKKIVVESGAGQITILGSMAPNTTVEAKVRKGSKCGIKVELRGTKLLAKVEKNSCEVEWTINGPSKADIETNLGAGDSKIEGVEGKLNISLGSGDVQVKKVVSNQVVLNSGAGNSVFEGIFQDLDITKGAGNLELRFEKAPRKGSLQISGGTGNTEVFAPADWKCKINQSIGVGKFSSDFASDIKAEYLVDISTGAGNVSLHTR